jgi:ATP-dependent DNA helicase RecG
LQAPVAALHGVGARQSQRLAKLGLHRVEDLLFHLPLRYEDRTRRVPLGAVVPGESVLVSGEIQHAEIAHGRRRRLICRLNDGTGALDLVFFHFFGPVQTSLRRGVRIEAFGEIRAGYGPPQIIHPEWHLQGDVDAAVEPAGLTPVYPTTEGLHQAVLRRLVDSALAAAERGVRDDLPALTVRGESLPGLLPSLRLVHRPPVETSVQELTSGRHPAVRRLVLDELIGHRLSLLRLRQQHQQAVPAPALAGSGELRERFLSRLDFTLTGAQQRVVTEVLGDLARSRPMLRLVQGDVGSGKTVVAATAALAAVEEGWQAAVMAPTELLAEQHYRTFRDWLEPLGVRVGWFSGRLPLSARRDAAAALAGGDIQVAVGTHALFQDQVCFARLGLAIVDEQHRFGVHQRLALRDKGADAGTQPHQLVMTATPIPRTLAMTAYADLDVSVIDELPPGRTPVATVAVPDSRRDEVIERVRAACAGGRQAYWVCTLIEESDALEAEAAEATAARLVESLPGLRVGLVHGRLKSAEKEAAMHAFEAGELDLLVATTVIEVGVNVPNASLMIIENPERLGLAQLHQLRGRVGRGAAESSCVLLYRRPLSDAARARLGVLRESSDGFRIADRDLEIRGPGELLGTRQTGSLLYRVADLNRDAELLPEVRRLASRLLPHGEAVDRMVGRWVGEGERYAQV